MCDGTRSRVVKVKEHVAVVELRIGKGLGDVVDLSAGHAHLFERADPVLLRSLLSELRDLGLECLPVLYSSAQRSTSVRVRVISCDALASCEADERPRAYLALVVNRGSAASSGLPAVAQNLPNCESFPTASMK